jgi:hypothetical protein
MIYFTLFPYIAPSVTPGFVSERARKFSFFFHHCAHSCILYNTVHFYAPLSFEFSRRCLLNKPALTSRHQAGFCFSIIIKIVFKTGIGANAKSIV